MRSDKLPPRGHHPDDYGANDSAPPRRWPMLLIGIAVGLLLSLLWHAAVGQPRTALDYTQKPVPLLLKRTDTRAIDGDTLVLNGDHVRLFGIDAPELGQTCRDGWPAGEKSRGFLRTLILNRTVACDNRGHDQYGRTLAVCTVDGDDINSIMVRTGNALAYSHYSRKYVLDEIDARQHKAGMWAHNCQAPWDWRHRGNSGR